VTAGRAIAPSGSFDVFLSHSSTDKHIVAALAAALRERGLKPWLDAEQVVPGVPFQSQLAEGLAGSRCFAVFVGQEDVGSWVYEELDAAMARAAGDRSFRVFLVLLPTAPKHFEPTDLHHFISQRTWVDLRSVERTERRADLLARSVRGEPLGFVDHSVDATASTCPYVGLRPFDVGDSPWFFGRDPDTQRMVEKLRRSPFLAVLGPSGSGKSSAVRAGLVPALAAGRLIAGSERWTIRVLRPSVAPLEVLAAHVSRLRPDMSVSQILGDLATDDVALKLLTAGREDAETVVWVVDQAEELFTLCDSSEQRRAFAANLLHASHIGGTARVVFTLRSDFYARFAELKALSARIASNQHVVTDLDSEQFERVVTEPATLAGLSLEAGLVDRIVNDVHDQAGALPLLQHALRELWEHRRGSELTHEAYSQIGGVEGALSNRADEVLAALDAAGDGVVVRRLMVELTRLGEGAEYTKQPVVLNELEAPAYPLERLHRVAGALADARLVTTDIDDRASGRDDDVADREEYVTSASGHGIGPATATRVELAHEALIRSWPALQAWLDESRDDLRARQHIRDAARAWQEQGRPDDLLYRGTALALARERLSDRLSELPKLEAEFLGASTDREDTARARARKRRARQLTVLATLTVLTLVAAIIATGLYLTARSAQRDERESAALALAQQARALASTNPALALAVSAEALERLDSPDTASALQVAHLAYGQTPGHLQHTLGGHTDWVNGVAFNPDGTLVATTSRDGTAKLWDPANGDEIRTLSGHDSEVVGVAFNPDGTLVATTSSDRTARLWDPASGNEITTLTGHVDRVNGVAFNPDGTLVATASRDGTAKLWDPANGDEIRTLSGHDSEVVGVAFNPDGTLVATTSSDRTARLWDPASGNEITTLTGHNSIVVGVAFNPDGTLVATASRDGTAKLWDPANGEEITTLTGHVDRVNGVAFNPDGTLVATTSSDRTARLWDPASNDEIRTLSGHVDRVYGVAFNPDGTLVATASRDGTAKLWDPAGGNEITTLTGHVDRVYGVAFNPDGTLVATASRDGTAKLWDPANGEEIRTLSGHDSEVVGVAFNPDGTLVATASRDGTAKLWDPAGGNEITTLTGHVDRVNGVAFNPDGTLVATASRDGTAKLWDPANGDEIRTLSGNRGRTLGAREGDLTAVVFDGVGTLVATASWDGTAKLWDPANGEEITTLIGHVDRVYGVAFNADGTLVATASADNTALMRNVVLTPEGACALVIGEVSRDDLTAALGDSAPQACTDL
jgi:WD40 repeat protein